MVIAEGATGSSDWASTQVRGSAPVDRKYDLGMARTELARSTRWLQRKYIAMAEAAIPEEPVLTAWSAEFSPSRGLAGPHGFGEGVRLMRRQLFAVAVTEANVHVLLCSKRFGWKVKERVAVLPRVHLAGALAPDGSAMLVEGRTLHIPAMWRPALAEFLGG
jgi:hypothetical protein